MLCWDRCNTLFYKLWFLPNVLKIDHVKWLNQDFCLALFFSPKSNFRFFSAANHSRPEPSPTNIKKKCKHFLRKENLAKNRHWTIVIRSKISKIDVCFKSDVFNWAMFSKWPIFRMMPTQPGMRWEYKSGTSSGTWCFIGVSQKG